MSLSIVKYLGIAGLLLMAGCSVSAEEEVARSFCSCYEPIIEAQQALESGLADSLPMEKRTALADALVYARIASKSCLQEALLAQQEAGLSDEDLNQLMQTQCPEVYANYAGEVAP